MDDEAVVEVRVRCGGWRFSASPDLTGVSLSESELSRIFTAAGAFTSKHATLSSLHAALAKVDPEWRPVAGRYRADEAAGLVAFVGGAAAARLARELGQRFERAQTALEQWRQARPGASPAVAPSSSKPSTRAEAKAREKAAIIEALQATDWNTSKAAEIVGIPRRTFYRRLDTYGIEAKR